MRLKNLSIAPYLQASGLIPAAMPPSSPTIATTDRGNSDLLVQTIAASITQALFAAQTNQKSPEELLLEDLRSHHQPAELYPIWRVAALARSIGFELFVLGEGSSQLKEKLGMGSFSPAVAHRGLKAIVIDDLQICRLACDICVIRPSAALTAVTLHEASHLLDSTPGSDLEREQRAWAMARSLLSVHQLYAYCSEWEFDRVAQRCLESYLGASNDQYHPGKSQN
jgi:hypothetical protein